jgi:stearoyl-CoA desaturase (delta-9 desaturase)
MNYPLAFAALVFGYLINMFYITVLFHRGFAHGSVALHPRTRKWAARTGSWVTGIDPKAWACMHRLHHRHSDTPLDPHSPVQLGVFGVMFGQLRSYEKILVGLIRGKREYTEVVKDLDFEVSWLNRQGLWWIPYVLHAVLALAIGALLHSGLVGLAYLVGIMSHPFQGWLVNSFAHHSGYQNHANGDHSRNNTIVALLAMGEGYQNNHHANPMSAKFSERWFEIDPGYGLCVVASYFGVLSIAKVLKRGAVSTRPHSAEDRIEFAH